MSASNRNPNPLASLQTVASHLEKRQLAFALVGGLAVSIRADVRFTRDIDFAISTTSDADTEQLVQSLQASHYEILALVEQKATQRLATVRLKSASGIIVDLLAARCGIEPEIVMRADHIAVGDFKMKVARAEELLAMKILSTSSKRKQDAVDIDALLDCNPDMNLSTVRDNLSLITHRGFARQQDLHAKLDEALASRG
jgi:predicted nucleotidyltransferase